MEQRNSLGSDNTLHTAGFRAAGPQRGGLVDDGLGFKILLVGDSTVRVRHTWYTVYGIMGYPCSERPH